MTQSETQSINPAVAIVFTSHTELGDTGKPTGAWYSEIAIPYYIFEDEGCRVTLASIKGGPGAVDPMSRLPEWQTDATKRFDADAVALAALGDTVPVDQLRPAEIDIILTPGGFGAMWDFPQSTALRRLVETFATSGAQIVVTLCHGAASLVEAKDAQGWPLVRRRKLTCLTNSEERAVKMEETVPFLLESRLRELGAEFCGGPDWGDVVHWDGWLVSGQNPTSAAQAATIGLKALAALRR